MKDQRPDRPSKPWWRHPMMWLVVGGPLAVVIAGVTTAAIAIRGADVVLPTQDATQVRSEAPAVQARNHAATPLPTTKP